jgi:glycosyltransferase XagB
MSDLSLRLLKPRFATAQRAHRPLGEYLLEAGKISRRDLSHALQMQRQVDAPLGDVLVAHGLISRTDVYDALAKQFRAQRVDLTQIPPGSQMAGHLPASLCLRFNAVPWMEIGGVLFVATSRPDRFEDLRRCLGAQGATLLMVVTDDNQICAEIGRLYGAELAAKAETRVPAAQSCRGARLPRTSRRRVAAWLLSGVALLLLVAPFWTLTVAMLWAVLTLVMSTTLKVAALCSHLKQGRSPPPAVAPIQPFKMPRVSILVPLLQEEEIADALVKRLTRLTYPKSLLDVLLVLEAGDEVTRHTLARTELPPWINVVAVPEAAGLKTKPRALNYALDFCRGSIIGVWDAEDAPEPDQIEKVVTRFDAAPDNVACLQGRLDYYNMRTNWISRCFTIEYATWWRVLLPGVARLGLVVPLGGTTLFFRRDILDKLGGWDAHNVTEDADLGVRLARHGYVTELVDTVTFEEANCRAWPWVRQRSRWLKGFLMTWCVHMRAPRQLLADLGWKRFLGVQTLLLATFSQFACAPLLWSFWLTLAGLPHPVSLTLGDEVMMALIVFFIAAETLNLGLSMVALSGPRHRRLMGWVFSLPIYYLLGTLAAGKALYEWINKPFFWDKTQHGVASDKI